MPNLSNEQKAAARKAAAAKAAAAKAAKANNADNAKADKPIKADNPELRSIKNLARDAETVVKQATNFNQYSDRDTAYLAFFGSVMRANGDKATLRQIHDAGKAIGNRRVNPLYTGSAKATDAGAINRLIKAGYIRANASGDTLTATDAGKSLAAYNGKAK